MKDFLVTYIILPMRWDDFRVAPYGKRSSLIWLDPLNWLQRRKEFGKLFSFLFPMSRYCDTKGRSYKGL